MSLHTRQRNRSARKADRFTPLSSTPQPRARGRPLCGVAPTTRARLRRCALCPLLALCPALAGARLAAQQAAPTDTARETARVSGVVQRTTGAPAVGVTVDLIGTHARASITDSGTFAFDQIPPGRYTLVAHGPRWTTTRLEITASAGRETRLTVTVADAADSTADATSDATAAASGAAALPTLRVEARRAASVVVPGPGVSPTGANQYTVTARDIAALPEGENTTMTDLLVQMPGVAIDQNQQIHIRNTEGPQFQYEIDGAIVPLDINTNPPFISMINPAFVSSLTLLDGILPSRYSYATGGVVSIATKNGCASRGGSASLLFGQRNTLQPAVEYAGCAGTVSYFVSGQFEQGETAFSSATPGPNPIHNETHGGQGFASLSVPLGARTTLGVVLSSAGSNNELPNVPDLPPQYTLAGVTPANSSAIDSHLNFRDYLGMVTLRGAPTDALRFHLTYAFHSITQDFRPDDAGELIYQGVASTASHADLDNTLQADVDYTIGQHTITTGVYLGEYHVVVDDHSLVFPADSDGNQTSSTPITVVNNARATNLLTGIYVSDRWQLGARWTVNLGLRWDDLTGFTANNQVDPTINVAWVVVPQVTVHGGFARYMQVPSFQGISPTASMAFEGTTAAGPAGISTPLTEDDVEWDAGVVYRLNRRLTLSEDAFYEITHHYLDTGQFGVVPIFAPFNYDRGSIWGTETAVAYRDAALTLYGSATIGRNLQRGVVTGQFNFDPDELAYINSHAIVLDHQPLYGASAGASYRWRPLTFGLDGVYSSGLRGGFADLEHLPTVVQVNASVKGEWRVPGLGTISDRVTVLNLLDRVNLIRPSEGIGIFQSAYGPRITLLDTISITF